MRALRALAGTEAANPITEYDVYRLTAAASGQFHSALATLVARGLAARTGRPGGYQWYITQAGTDLLVIEGGS